MVRIILTKIDDPKQQLEVKIHLHETQTTDKWISLLKKAPNSTVPAPTPKKTLSAVPI